MTGAPGAELEGDPEIVELGSVPGFVVFDLPGAPLSAGGTRLAPDISAAEVAVLARSMTYKFAALGARVGGAKAGVRGDPADRAGKAALATGMSATGRTSPASSTSPTGPPGSDPSSRVTAIPAHMSTHLRLVWLVYSRRARRRRSPG